MIVYNGTKRDFIGDVNSNQIAGKILDEVRKKGLMAGQDKEFQAWENSLRYIGLVVDTPDLEDEVNIAIEYNIPQTDKRVDFIISGSDVSGGDHIVIVELKQWTDAEKVADNMRYSVRTWVANDYRIVCHPSYQAFSYSRLISNFCEPVSTGEVSLHPCAYLHNFQASHKHVLTDGIYRQWYENAPFFISNETEEFRKYLLKFVSRRSPKGDLLWLIDNGRLRPSKSLQESLADMVRGSHVFDLIDEQGVCFDLCLKAMEDCLNDGKKRTVIIKGGPGTGKSVLAVNLLNEFIGKGLMCSYVTKNSAPRNAFTTILSNANALRLIDIKQLFRSPFRMCDRPFNFYDCLIIDEAHRLVQQMYGDFRGQNQVRECITASKLSIFFLDEDQIVTTKDIGTVDEVLRWCRILGSEPVMNDETTLHSQFRCNGSDAFISLVDSLLQRKQYDGTLDQELLHYDFQVFDSPVEMRDALRKKNALENKSRMVAGYCYDWNVRNNRGPVDIYLPDGFQAKWNLAEDNIWAINPASFEEVGCIHTAQGLEFDWVGVLIGKDLRYDPVTKRIVTDKTAISRDDHSSGIRMADDQTARRLILNTYKTLLTRGQKGCYVYCEDDALRKYFKAMMPR